MTKKLIGFAAAAAAAVSMMVPAFGGELTASDVLLKMNLAQMSAKAFSAGANGNASIKLDIPDAGMTMDLAGDITEDMALNLDPLKIAVSSSMSGSAMGQDAKADVQMYLISEDDGIHVYANAAVPGEASEWQHQVLSSDESLMVLDMIEQMTSGSFDVSQLPIEYELTDGTVEKNGHTCYELTCALTWEDLLYAMNYAMAAMGSEDVIPMDQLDMVGQIVGGLKLNMDIQVDSETFLPVAAHLDMDGSDWTVTSAFLASMMGLVNEDGSLMQLNLDISSLYLDMTYDFNDSVTIDVPAEALSIPATQTDMSDLSDIAASTIG